MTPAIVDPSLFQAEWFLGRLPPEAVPDLAAALLTMGYDGEHLRILAGISVPSRVDVDEVMQSALNEVGLPPIDHVGAAWIVVRSIAAKIVSGELKPHDGAREIGVIARSSRELGSLTVFAGLASEWDDDRTHRAEYEAAIRQEAGDLVGDR